MNNNQLIVMANLIGLEGYKVVTPKGSAPYVTFKRDGKQCVLTKKQFIDTYIS